MTVNRASLPDFVNLNGKTYKLNIHKTNTYNDYKIKDKGILIVHVLPHKLKNKLDLHGKPYKPSTFIFTAD